MHLCTAAFPVVYAYIQDTYKIASAWRSGACFGVCPLWHLCRARSDSPTQTHVRWVCAGRLHVRCSWAPLPACAQPRAAHPGMQPNPAYAEPHITNPVFQASENVADAIAVEMPLAPPHPQDRSGSKMKKFVGHQRLQFAQVCCSSLWGSGTCRDARVAGS